MPPRVLPPHGAKGRSFRADIASMTGRFQEYSRLSTSAGLYYDATLRDYAREEQRAEQARYFAASHYHYFSIHRFSIFYGQYRPPPRKCRYLRFFHRVSHAVYHVDDVDG